jgi:hypothetical protein
VIHKFLLRAFLRLRWGTCLLLFTLAPHLWLRRRRSPPSRTRPRTPHAASRAPSSHQRLTSSLRRNTRWSPRRKRVVDSASKRRHSLCLMAKEAPFYESATSKASRVQAAKLDLSEASTRMKAALDTAGVLERPPPSASHRASCTFSPTCVAFHALPTAARRCSPLCDVYYNACFLWRLAARHGSPSTDEGPVSV